MENYITPEALAKQLDTTVGTLATWRMNGRYDLPFVKIGRKVLYRESEVESWIKSRTYQTTSQMEGV